MSKSKSKVIKNIEDIETVNMEEVMTEEVKETKSEPSVADLLKEALAVAQATPAKVSGTGATTGELSTMLLSLLNASDAPLAGNQLLAGVKALGRTQTTSKNISDYVWGLWKRGLVNKGAVKGTYQKLGLPDGVPYNL